MAPNAFEMKNDEKNVRKKIEKRTKLSAIQIFNFCLKNFYKPIAKMNVQNFQSLTQSQLECEREFVYYLSFMLLLHNKCFCECNNVLNLSSAGAPPLTAFLHFVAFNP